MSERQSPSIRPFNKEGDVLSPSLFGDNSMREELKCHLSAGATPLAGIEHPDVIRLQNEVVQPELIRRTVRSAPYDVPLPVRAFMVRSFMTRFAGRAAKNYDSYSERLVMTPPWDISSEFAELHERAMRGTASPETLFIVRRTLGMKAIELARVTHPYGAEIHLLDPMRQTVAAAIENQDGCVFEPEDYNEQYKIRSTDLLSRPGSRNEAMALLMTRRRQMGFLEDDTLVMERSSFVVPIYEGSAYDASLSKKMRAVAMVNNPYRLQELEEAGKLQEVVPDLLKTNDFKAAFPQSTTVFAYNETTAHEIEAEKERQKSHADLELIHSLTMMSPNYRPGMIEAMRKTLNEMEDGRQ